MVARYAIGALLVASLSSLGCGKNADAVRLPEKAEVAQPSRNAVALGVAGNKSGGSAGAESQSRTLAGTTEAHRRSTLTPKVSSSVTKVFVRDGDIIKPGQTLVAMDTRDFALRTQAAEASLEQAKVGLDATQLEWNRIKKLTDENAVPSAQFDQVDAKLKGAKAAVSAAETAVAMTRKALSDSVVTAPFGGVVVKRHTNEGEYAAMMPPTPLITIEEIDPLDVRIQVPSSDMDRVHMGDRIRLRIPASNTTIDMAISRIVPSADPRTRSFAVVLELPNHDHALRSGLYVEAELLPSTGSGAHTDGGRLSAPTAPKATTANATPRPSATAAGPTVQANAVTLTRPSSSGAVVPAQPAPARSTP